MNPVAAALGARAVLELAELVGGRTLRIPSMANDASATAARARLVRLVGAQHAENLITHFARSRVYFPRGPSPHNSRANPIDHRTVARLTKRGRTASQIADSLGCSERTVFAKRAKVRASQRKRP